MNNKSKAITPKLLLMDFSILIVFALLAMFSIKSIFTLSSPFSQNIAMCLYIPAFIATAFGFGFIIFVEFKYKRLRLNNFLIYLGLALAFFNLLATVIIPNNYVLPNGIKLNLDFNKRLISILIGFAEAGLILFYFFVLPKLLNNQKYIKAIYGIIILFALLCILISLLIEGKTYIEILKSGFSTDLSVKSIFAHKNAFGSCLFIGIATTIFVSTLTHNYKWLIPSIPMIIFILFTSCKIALLLTGILVLCFAVYQIIKFAKMSKDNLFITLICAAFVLAIGVTISIFIVFSNAGLLFKIKSVINELFSKGSSTFRSRIEIWKCSFALLSPIQYIFGCGTSIFCEALNLTYTLEQGIWNSHNAYIELIGEGGIIKLLIYVALQIALIYYLAKIYKKNREFGFFYFTFITLYLIYGIVEPFSVLNFDSSHLFNIVLILPIMSIYYYSIDNKSINENKKLTQLAKTIKVEQGENLFSKLNKRYIKFKGTCISNSK